MKKKDISEAIDYCCSLRVGDSRDLFIILIDGTIICSKIPLRRRMKRDKESGKLLLSSLSEYIFLIPNHLKLMHEQHEIYVPFSQIAGIMPIQYFESRCEVTNIESHEESVSKLLFLDMLQKARKHSFKIQRFNVWNMGLSIDIDAEKFKWCDTNFANDTPLYCDWEFLSKTSGGLTSLGAGFALSFSIGWKKSLWSSFKSRVNQTTTELSKVCNKREVTISGYIHLLKSPTNKEYLKMENETWTSAIIAQSELKKIEKLKTQWVLVYFKESSFMFPSDLWDRISQKITVYGEIIPANIETEFGKRKCFLKARAAAYLK